MGHHYLLSTVCCFSMPTVSSTRSPPRRVKKLQLNVRRLPPFYTHLVLILSVAPLPDQPHAVLASGLQSLLLFGGMGATKSSWITEIRTTPVLTRASDQQPVSLFPPLCRSILELPVSSIPGLTGTCVTLQRMLTWA